LKHKNCWRSVWKAVLVKNWYMILVKLKIEECKNMLKVSNLKVAVENTEILKGIDLEVKAGEIHAIMGPNGSGKSTLANVLAGREEYEILDGMVTFKGKNLLEMAPEDRAREGLFLAFQYPVEIPGVSMANFLKQAVNEIRQYRGQESLNARTFLATMKEKLDLVRMDEKFISRSVNEGFSGGEKKRNEIFQMAMLDPSLAILDETDSGLDIDALKIVAEGVNKLRRKDNAFIVVTHYQRLLNYIIPDFVHVLYQGKIVESGDKELALHLEEYGYDWVKEEAKEQQAVEE
jgi:Fe-S cluster assembly ATP-binding protein